MTDYKCICCGEAKQSDKDCTCPSCGYKMYPIPFERHTVLVNEIMGFLNQFSLASINIDDINLFRMDKNVLEGGIANSKKENSQYVSKEWDSRFPSFHKIQNYVCSSKKNEVFCERLSITIDQLNKHIHEVFQQNYYVDMANIITNQSKREECFLKAMKVLDVNIEFDKLKFEKITLNYTELPNEVLLPLAENLIELLTELSLKIKLFIKQYNIYGVAYQEKIKSNFKYNELTTDSKNEFEKCINKVQTVLNKKYVVDIFSDGSDELKEMLKVLWNAIYTSMKLPVLNKVWKFSFSTGESFDGNAFYNKINKILSSRFETALTELKINNVLCQKTEEEVFESLKQMMNLDTVGYFNSDNNNLRKTGKFERELNKLIGLSSIKNSIQKIKAYAITNKDSDCLNINMCFYGNPGTGKTEVARLIAGILYENKILPTNNVVEVDRSGLVSQYFGATAEKTNQVINSALGGVLFIDEAYALGNNSNFGEGDYGREAIDVLVKAMEDYRGKICIIFAGYKNQMKTMIDVNPGFKSRIPFHLDFENYSRKELKKIAELIISNKGYKISESAINRILDITDVKRKEANFANARELRNILEQVIMCQNLRNVGTDDKEIVSLDVNNYIEESKVRIPFSAVDRSIALSGNDELNRLIGLESVKKMVKKINAYARMNKDNEDFNLHMTFSGNPGTGKTEVARLISRILYDSKILPEAKVIETNAQGLLGKYVGETGPKTQKLIQDAMGGVLFIDEAYSLIHSKNINSATSYGEEAISTLLKSMEDYRGQFCVIFAGYKVEMADLINYNPGLSSRVQFALDFPDYTQDELKEIAMLFLKKKHYEIEDEALSYILDISKRYREMPHFANARTVRNIVDQVIMNQNLRAEDDIKNRTIIYSDVEEYDLDLKKVNDANKSLDKRIGF